jgi:hypothetical protein
MKLKLKGCNHCGGDLVPDNYENDGTMICLQCGRPARRRTPTFLHPSHAFGAA